MADQFPAVIEKIDEFSEKILSREEILWFRQHISEGAPGFLQYLQSERAKKAARVMIDDYFTFLKTGK